MTDRSPLLAIRRLRFGFARRADFLGPMDLDLHRNQCCGIIGPNGAGKSTLLRLLAGLVRPTAGDVILDGRPLADMPAAQRARRIAYLPQNLPDDLPLTAGEVVLMGRYPHRRFGLFEDAADERIADDCLRTTETFEFKHRPMSTLSGGEAQRVHLAAALAQQPAILLLDEPTAALDLYHQIGIFQTLRRLAVEQSLLIVAVTHDLNLAARFCDRVVLLDGGRLTAAGPTQDVLRPAVLEPVYRVELRTIEVDGEVRIVPGRARPPGGDARP